MKTLDRSRPYSEVIGMAHVRYGQDGAYFSADDREVVEAEGFAPVVEAAPPVTREDLEKLHWTKLRSRARGLDIEYTTREEAIEAILSHG